jgi:hypothetical protein
MKNQSIDTPDVFLFNLESRPVFLHVWAPSIC